MATCLVRPQTIDLKNLTITIFFSLLVMCKFVASDFGGTTMIGTCITTYNMSINNETGLDDYRDTLGTLLSNLAFSSSSSPSSYFNSTAGQSPAEKAYGLYLCRGDASSDVCRTCVENLTAAFSLAYDNCKEGFTYKPDDCMIHYANYSFFGISNNRASISMPSKFAAATSIQEYNRTLEGVLNQVIAEAAFNSTAFFATREARVQGNEKVYALAQCTPDLNNQTCSGCLNSALSRTQPYQVNNTAFDCGNDSRCVDTREIDGFNPNDTFVKSNRVILPSCQLSFDNASFYTSNSPQPVSPFLVATWTLLFIQCMFLLS